MPRMTRTRRTTTYGVKVPPQPLTCPQCHTPAVAFAYTATEERQGDGQDSLVTTSRTREWAAGCQTCGVTYVQTSTLDTVTPGAQSVVKTEVVVPAAVQADDLGGFDA